MNTSLVKFDQLQADLTLEMSQGKDIIVIDNETKDLAMFHLKKAASFRKNIEATYKEIVAPALEFQREAKAYSNKLLEISESVEKRLKSQLIVYDKRLEAERQADLKRIQVEREQKEIEARKLAEESKKEAEAMAIFGPTEDATRAGLVADAEAERLTADIAKEARKEEKAVMENKVSGIRSIWKFEVTEIDNVPEKYWVIDEAAIGRDVRSGVREIKGVRIFEEKTMGVR